ncbi:hypothetical protein LIER_37184 [Lithospermum erythrorhizon]|uniref:Uncharacterized protein n=1 Tax=Lithospermum erythrorhizon TaxID=34254 RepID=A0AAV3PKH7_LITER
MSNGGCLHLLSFSRWSHYPVLANLGPERRIGPRASQSGGVRAVAARSSSPSKQPPQGCCSVGSRLEEGPG